MLRDWISGRAARLSAFYPTSTAQAAQVGMAQAAGTPAAPADLYAMLRAYYQGNGLYDRLARALYESGVREPAMRAVRNPAFRVVEFYVASIWPGPLGRALPIEAENERIVEPIERVWTWSNWAANKQVFARTVPMIGDGFIKVVQNDRGDRVYFQLIAPEHVTEFDADERGYLTYCRIDVPIRARERDSVVARTHTEVWSKADGTFRRWTHAQGLRPVEELGQPLETTDLRQLGVDFVPIVHCKFRDVGEDRGVGAYTLQLEKIDEVNRKATRLGQQLFRHNGNTWVVESSQVDREGRPMPALRTNQAGTVDGVVPVRLGDETMMSLPGGYSLKSVVPNIDYRASLDAVLSDMADLQQDLPEIAYWTIPESQGDASGRALRVKLLPALSRAEEARANLEDALVRANQMALTIGQNRGLPGFEGLGSYDDGDFAHGFAERDVIPLSDLEAAQGDVQKATAAKLRVELGVSKRKAQQELGYTEQEIDEMAQEKEADQSDLAEAMGALMDRQPGARVGVNGRGALPQDEPVVDVAAGG
jgi:type IV secretory pathway protease TraF